MSIKISCQDCGSKYKVAEAAAGKKVKCKKCGTILHIPALVPAGNDDSGPMLGFRDEEPAPKPAPKPAPLARTASAKPVAKPIAPRQSAAPARPVAKRPPPPPPAEENSLDDLAALAHGDLLPPEELPTAPAAPVPTYRPPAAATTGRAKASPLGYVTPRQAVLQQPAYISQWGGLLIMAAFVAPFVNGILGLIFAANHADPGTEVNWGVGITALFLDTGISAIRTCISAAIALGGIKIAGSIMKFDTNGGYSSVLMILGWPAILSIAFMACLLAVGVENLPVIVAAGCLAVALMLVGSIRLLKDAFVLTWSQTAVAVGMVIGIHLVIIAVILVVVAMIAGGFAVLMNRL